MGETQTSNNKSMFLSLAKVIQGFCQKVEKIQKKIPEIIASITYVVAHIFMGFYHEPWYDESVAWQIARCASIKDILFEIPHYEGHPPLWYIILVPFAKLGAPYELSLCLVSMIFAGAACCLIIWKSPFPRIIRLLLPFTYFFFYQYGVISRPYCVMMLAFVLLAMAHEKRNEKPGIYVAVLMLLCITSAYGILIAGGLTIAWIIEMWNFQNVIVFVKKMLRDKRTIWLFALLILALMMIAVIMPREDTYATSCMPNQDNVWSYIRCFIYMFFALPMDVSMTNIYSDCQLLKTADITLSSLIITSILGIILWTVIILWGRCKKTLLTLVIPYIMYATFAGIVYIYTHHIGIGLYILVFWFWITLKKENQKEFMAKSSKQTKDIVFALCVLFGSLSMVISISWNVASCVQDVLYTYAIGKTEAKFIKENGLDNYRIMTGWKVDFDEDGNVERMDVNHASHADSVAPYFDHNIFFNFNNGEDSLNYSTHRNATEQEIEESIANWKKQKPDVIYMYPQVELIYDDIDLYAYKTVFYHRNYKTWKGFLSYEDSRIYVHEDLLEELGLDMYDGGTYARMSLYAE